MILNDDFEPNSLLTEKKQRADLMSKVERELARDKMLIVDSYNYIKGFRYQLYCLGRAAKIPSCVVYVETSKETILDRIPNGSYLIEMVKSFEEPIQGNRWDDPLFVIQEYDTEEIVEDIFRDLLKAISTEGLVKQPNAVKDMVLADTDYLQELEETTKKVIKEVQSGIYEFSRPVSIGELKKMKKEFMTYCKQTRLEVRREAFKESFLGFIRTRIQ
ncbi:hypothetical protein MP638_007088 [Amoeboaphelidium occidentale]|nr:hypothetical protein MP638_007088 [Amoeboaphelidium occidentale]